MSHLVACLIDARIIFGGDSERFAHFSAKYLIEIGLMGEISCIKMKLSKRFVKISR